MQASKIEQRVRIVQKRPENKHCFDCSSPGLQTSVVFPFGIFVCTSCSGIHRQFEGHHVATITMSNFTDTQAQILENNGNAAVERVWLATFEQAGLRKPNQNNINGITTFIKNCFVDKRWYNPNGPQHGGNQQPQQQPQQQQQQQQTLPRPTGSLALRSPSNAQQQQQQQQQQVQSQSFQAFSQPSPALAPQTNIFPPSEPLLSATSSSPAGPAATYAALQFPWALPTNQVSPAHLELVKTLSRTMASTILANNLSASDFAHIVSTAAQVTAGAYAQREANQHGGNTTATPSAPITPTATPAIRPPSQQQQQQQSQNILQRPQSQQPQQQLYATPAPIQQQPQPQSVDLFANFSSPAPVQQQQQPAMQSTPFDAAFASPAPQQQQQQRAAAADNLFFGAPQQPQPQQSMWGQAPPQQQQQQPQPQTQVQPHDDDFFGGLVGQPSQPQQQSQQGGWGQPQQPQQQQQSGWGQPQQQPQQQQGGWGQPQQQQQPQQFQQQGGWGQPQPQAGNWGQPQQQQQPYGMMGGMNNMNQGMNMGGMGMNTMGGGYPQQPQVSPQQAKQEEMNKKFADIDLPF